jgi:hypothetical protein
MDQTSSNLEGTVISPAIRREFGDVFSMRTATNSQESWLPLTSLCSVPPNHQTLSADGDDAGLGGVTTRRLPDGTIGDFVRKPSTPTSSDRIVMILISQKESKYQTKQLIYEPKLKQIGFYCNILLSVFYVVLSCEPKRSMIFEALKLFFLHSQHQRRVGWLVS